MEQGNKYITIRKANTPYVIRAVSLKNFNSYRKYYNRDFLSVNDFQQYAETEADGCVFEVIVSTLVKVYLDFENIPVDQPELYKEILRVFFDYAGIDSKVVPYVVTLNKGSRHPGLSYHVIISVITTQKNLRNLIANFLTDYKEYAPYVDHRVYNHNRLFRIPDQYGILRNDRENLPEGYDKRKDVHRVIEVHNYPCTYDDIRDHYHLVLIQVIQHDTYCMYNRLWQDVTAPDISEANKSTDFGLVHKAYEAMISMYKYLKNIFA